MSRYEVWVVIPGMGDVPDRVITEAPDADTAILRAGMALGEDFEDQAHLAIVIEVRDENGRLAE